MQNEKHKFPECRRWCCTIKPKTDYIEDYIEQYGFELTEPFLCDNESAECFMKRMGNEYKINKWIGRKWWVDD